MTTPPAEFFARLTRNALVGAVAGLLVGLLLVAATDLDNPFWWAAVGIGVAAVLSDRRAGSGTARRGD